MPKKYYNPQDDVVQIKDGKRTPIQAYDLYGALHAGPKPSGKTATAELQSTKPSHHASASDEPLSLRFDGQYLTIIHKEGNKTTEYNYPAVSGKPITGKKDTFDYSPERQTQADQGPIPEGKHEINLDSTRYFDKEPWWQQGLGMVGRGKFPGGSRSWGEGRIDVNLDPEVAKKTGRGGITIHGGKVPGSRGCIDLVNNDKAFFSKLEELKGNKKHISLTVDYSKTPDKVKWNKGSEGKSNSISESKRQLKSEEEK